MITTFSCVCHACKISVGRHRNLVYFVYYRGLVRLIHLLFRGLFYCVFFSRGGYMGLRPFNPSGEIALVTKALCRCEGPRLLRLLLCLQVIVSRNKFGNGIATLIRSRLMVQDAMLTNVSRLFLFRNILYFLSVPSIFLNSKGLSTIGPISDTRGVRNQNYCRVSVICKLLRGHGIEVRPLQYFLTFKGCGGLSFLVGNRRHVTVIMMVRVGFLYMKGVRAIIGNGT